MMQVGLTQEDILHLDAPEDAAINCDRMHHIWQQEVSISWILKSVFIGIFNDFGDFSRVKKFLVCGF